MSNNSLNTFFSPQSIAVVGVSREKNKVGRIIFENILKNFQGEVYPVNPKAEKIANKKCYASLQELPEKVNLAAISLPAKIAPKILLDGVKAGIKNYILYSSGFSELGKEGEKIENKINEIIKENNLTLLGPNTLGYLNTNKGLNTSFTNIETLKGNISFVSQSGALISVLLDWAYDKNLGIDMAISLGNKLNLNENHVIEYLENRKQTQVIALYLENFADGKRFLEIANKTKTKKPIILLKGGRTEKGKQTAQSHTGKMTGSFETAKELLNHNGIVITEKMQDFYNFVYCFSKIELSDKNMVVVTNAGGAGVITADYMKNEPIELTPFSEKTKSNLKKILPDYATIKNPLDIAGDAEPKLFAQVMETVMKDPIEDAILIIVTPQAMTNMEETARQIKKLAFNSHKPIHVCLMGGKKKDKAAEILKDSPVIVIEYPEDAVTNFSMLLQHNKIKDKKFILKPKREFPIEENKIKNLFQEWGNNKIISAQNLVKLAEMYKLNLPKQKILNSEEELNSCIAEFNYPLVLKTNSLHKTDKKEVFVGLKKEAEVKKAFNKLVYNKPLLLQEMIKAELELIIGSKTDPEFGKVVICGLGGIYTEVLKEKIIFPAPSTKKDIEKIIKAAPFYELIKDGYRNQKRPTQKIIDLLYRFSFMASDFPNVESFEINPLLITENNIYAVDFRGILS